MRDFKKERRFGGGDRGESRGGFRDRGGFRGGSGGPGRDFSRGGEMHQATCARCGKMCEVPFRPNGKKPVFCKDCFKSSKPETSFRPSFQSERPTYQADGGERRGNDVQNQIEMLNKKIETLIQMVKALSAPSFEEDFSEEEEVHEEKSPAKKKKKPSKK